MKSRVYKACMRRLIAQHTELSKDHLTPEISLRLITPTCHLWRAKPEDSPFPDPFWAFFWPGGQALTRFILDNKALFYKKHILDVGSGCGSAVIACVMSEASHVVANDVDPVACVAIDMNIEDNKLSASVVQTDTNNYLSPPDAGQQPNVPGSHDIVLMGDMFYDPDFTHLISNWLKGLQPDTNVFIGDPGRLPFLQHPLKNHLRQVAQYDISKISQLENNGLTTASVWMLDLSR